MAKIIKAIVYNICLSISTNPGDETISVTECDRPITFFGLKIEKPSKCTKNLKLILTLSRSMCAKFLSIIGEYISYYSGCRL